MGALVRPQGTGAAAGAELPGSAQPVHFVLGRRGAGRHVHRVACREVRASASSAGCILTGMASSSISRRKFCLSASMLCAPLTAQTGSQKPNIVLILMD